MTSTDAQLRRLAQLMQNMYSQFHIVQVSFPEVDYVSTEVPELPVRVTRISSEVHR